MGQVTIKVLDMALQPLKATDCATLRKAHWGGSALMKWNCMLATLDGLVSNPQRLKDNVILYTDSKSVEVVNSTAGLLVIDLIVKVKETCSFDISWIKGSLWQ